MLVLDATNLRRNLAFAREALDTGLPAVAAVNMVDLAERQGLEIDFEKLEGELGCPVIPTGARSGIGIDRIRKAACEELGCSSAAGAEAAAQARDHVDSSPSRSTAEISAWADRVYDACVTENRAAQSAAEKRDDRIDTVLTHPFFGLIAFTAIMTGLFFTIFSLASVPMDIIELMFGTLGGWLGSVLPEGAFRDLMVDGIVGGLAGTLVFLPQICLLFFLISLLEDTGYLARAAFVLDRLMRRFGLPGHSFVPLLSAHACAIPAIMSTRLISDRRERLATVLIAPFMSCSARLPVYVLLVGILFPDDPLLAGIAFSGCYVLGAVVGLLTAIITRRTILKGRSPAMVIELPTYKLPSLRNAVLVTFERAWLFLRKAGTVILGICIVLWWLSAYPKPQVEDQVEALQARAVQVEADRPELAETLRRDAAILAQAEGVEEPAAEDDDQFDGVAAESVEISEAGELALAREEVRTSFAGYLGRAVEPVFAPLGIDWQLSVGVVTSFAAREVFVSTLAIVFAGTEEAESDEVLDRIRNGRRDDGTPVFTMPVAAAMLVFFVLAMQCLPTVAVTAREAGGWKWGALQLGYMTVVAYVFALITKVIVAALIGGA
jgi:ferrous iron transport protein B